MKDKVPFQNYIQRTEEIRALSTIALDNIRNAEGYQEQLKTNFTRIGELAALNREFLEKELFSLIDSVDVIDEADEELLIEFTDSLISASNAENLDLSIVSIIQEKLLENKLKGTDLDAILKYEDLQIGVYYELMLLNSRIRSYPEKSEEYRQKGLKLARVFMQLLEKDHFLEIDNPETREMILTNARYGVSFYDDIGYAPQVTGDYIGYLKKLHEIAADPFYKEVMGEDFDWTYFMFRLYQYSALATEENNIIGFDEEQLECCYQWSIEFERFWTENKEYIDRELGDTENYSITGLCVMRNSYLTGRISREEYFDKLIELYESRDMNSYSTGDHLGNLSTPVEIISLLEKGRISEREKTVLLNMYKNILSYAFYMPNDGTMFQVLELFCKFTEHFIEIPSVVTFEDYMLQGMAAFHPPTYVHTQMVGRITECLCSHLIRLMPEKLIGVKDTKSAEEVILARDQILGFAYHSTLCHDCGKLDIVDVVFIYGRKLLDMEFDLIKTHPKTGYDMLSKYESTREYAEVALGHHKWHDDSRGYPEDFVSSESKVKPIIDLVLCADCLDAATDTVGRSYNKGKTIESFTEELKAGSGDRYAPWLLELFADPLVKEDIDYLLSEGRNQKYKDIYFLLKNVHDAAE